MGRSGERDGGAGGPGARQPRWGQAGAGGGDDEGRGGEAASAGTAAAADRANADADDRAAEAAPPPPPPIYKPDFTGLSGKLAAEANTVNGVVLKFAPPPEARPCRDPRWRIYVFREQAGSGGGGGGGGGGEEEGGDKNAKNRKQQQEPVGEPIALDRHPYYLFGKERRVADIPTDHPSCSRQHAVVCFREVERLPEGGLLPSVGGAGAAGSAAAARAALQASRRVVPYLLDLEAANGTFLNGERVEASRFYEILDGDVVKFGASTREYVFICERSASGGAK
jgi:smad nuclear-interacting protein 1